MTDLVQEIDEMVRDETVSMARVLQKAGRRAIGKIVHTMEKSSSEGLQFKAAQDLADRAPETSKTQKVAVASFSIDGADVKELAAVLAEAGRIRAEYAPHAHQDFVRVNTDERDELPDHAKRIEAADGKNGNGSAQAPAGA